MSCLFIATQSDCHFNVNEILTNVNLSLRQELTLRLATIKLTRSEIE